MKPDKIYLSLALLIILSAFSWISSCTHKADLTGMYHPCIKEVSMIINSSCVSFVTDTVNHTVLHCHDGDGESSRRLDAVEFYRDSFDTLKNPYSNPVYKAITAKRGENKMPPSGPLSLDNRTIIRLWIEQGADTTTSLCDTTKVVSNVTYFKQRSGVFRLAPANLSLTAEKVNLKSGSIPVL